MTVQRYVSLSLRYRQCVTVQSTKVSLIFERLSQTPVHMNSAWVQLKYNTFWSLLPIAPYLAFRRYCLHAQR